eukprot:Blabericola_migrator_1__11853@NODE_721_length_6735_cov_131_696611_g519_i0_p1_GENE_NODE_721_length_6735_cov_131_696611_g519_i0NODE_721_length_6735_cov_131_696611_g519_i0_p1_ORF_typecomplete_len727_score102_04NIF/PF03031_18/2_5e34_NODE_721_length_6735_cov_131_696611_g519_i0372217
MSVDEGSQVIGGEPESHESSPRRPSMASPIPGGNEGVERYKLTDEDFESLQNFDWSRTRPEILNDLEFIARLPKEPGLDYESIGPSLPPKDPSAPVKSLFIDLDETIAHTALGNVPHPRTPDLVFQSVSDGSTANVYFRPWVDDFLRVVSQYYEIILYTASVKPYADLIVDELDVENRISHRLYREQCTQYGSTDIYFKDINGTGRDLKDSVVIDNRLISFGLNVDNGIFVSSFLGQSDDAELLQLIPLLIALSKQADVRISLAQTYRLPEIIEKFQMDNSHPTSPGSGISDDQSIPSPSPRGQGDLSLNLLTMGSPASHALPGVDKLEIHAQATAMIGSRAHTVEAEDSSFQSTSEDDDDNSSRDEEDELHTAQTLQALETIQEPSHEGGESSAVESVTDDTDTSAPMIPHPTLPQTEHVDASVIEAPPQRTPLPSTEREQTHEQQLGFSKQNGSHSPQRSGSRHLAALSKLSAAVPPEEPKEGKALDPSEPKPSQRELDQTNNGSWRRIILPLQPPSRRRRHAGKPDRVLLELTKFTRPSKGPAQVATPRSASASAAVHDETPMVASPGFHYAPPTPSSPASVPPPNLLQALPVSPRLPPGRSVTPPSALSPQQGHFASSSPSYRTFAAGSRTTLNEYYSAPPVISHQETPSPFPRVTYVAISPPSEVSLPTVYLNSAKRNPWMPQHHSPLVGQLTATQHHIPVTLPSKPQVMTYTYSKTLPYI